jgi:hypothetical protein
MSAPPHPPPGTTPGAFFETWLPAALAASGRKLATDAPAVRVTLSGPEGGEWRIHAASEGLIVAPQPPTVRRPDDELLGVWLRQSAPDFVASFAGDPDLPDLLPAGWTPLDLLFLDDRDVDMARQIAGRILLEIHGRRRRRWSLDVAFGKEGLTAGRPRATVQIDGTTYDGLRTRTIAPMQALLAGKVKVEGDRALAGKALMLVAARLTR